MKKLAAILWLALSWCALAQTRQVINLGAAANDGTGDSIRTAFTKANSNFSNLWYSVYTNGTGVGTTYLFDTNWFATSGTNVTIRAHLYLTNDWQIEGGQVGSVNNSIRFYPVYSFYAGGTNLTLVGYSVASLTAPMISVQATTELDLVTPAVNAATATTGQYLKLLNAATGQAEWSNAAFLPLAGGTMTGSINAGSQRITSVGTPTASADAATKSYVDTAVGNVNVAAAFPDSMGEITRLRQVMAGTGRVGVMAWPRNLDTSGITTNNGDGFAISRCVRRVPTSVDPQYWYLREIGTNTWFGYYTMATTFGTTNQTSPNVLYYRTLKPMLKYRVDAGGAVTDEDGGAVAYPMLTNVANNVITFSTATLNTSTRRLGVILGGTYTFGALCKVTITNNATGANVIPNMLPTVQNGIDNLSWSSGVTALGELTTSDYVLDTQGAQMMLHNLWHIPLADNLDPGSYTVTILVTQQKNNDVSNSGAQRAYIAYFTYGADSTTEATAGATLEVFGAASYRQKYSTSETYTFEVRPTAQGSYELVGCNHINAGRSGEQIDSLTHTVDGQVVIPWAKTATRSRTSNVSTITTASPHGLVTGDLVTVSKVGATAYNVEDASVTVTSTTAFTYANTGSDEGSTADTAGYVTNQKLWLGQKITQQRNTSLWHSSTNTPVMSGVVTYVFDKSGWISGATVTANMAIDLEKITYLGLNTVYGGASWGPEFAGQVNWRVIGTTTSGTFSDTATTDSNVTASYGKNAGFLVWGPTRATAYFSESPNMQMQNWAYGNFFAQDRGSSTGARGTAGDSKFYFQFTTTNAVTGIASGTVFRVRCTRLDADFQSAPSLFQ